MMTNDNAELIAQLRSRAREGHYADRGARYWFSKAADALDAADAERDAARQVVTADAAECTCSLTAPATWTRYGSAVEPGSMFEPDPDCPSHFPKATS